MVIEELQVDLLAQHVVRGDLDTQHFVTTRSLCDTLVDLAEQHHHVLVRHVHLQLQVIADLTLTAVFLLRDEIEVLDRVAATDHVLVRMSFGQLHTRHVQRQIPLFPIFGFQTQRVLHRQVQTNQRTKGFGNGHVRDIVSGTRDRLLGRYVAHEAHHLAVSCPFCRYPGRVGTKRSDRVLTGVRMRQRHGFEMVLHPR